MSLSKNTSAVANNIIISGPSGSGKSTLISLIKKDYETAIQFSVSLTTRLPRPNERNEVDYHFVTTEYFKELIENDRLLEYVEINGNYYGTSKFSVEEINRSGKLGIFDVKASAALQMRTSLGRPTILLFIKPPSIEVLEERLLKRATETLENIQQRVEAARQELSYEQYFDRVIVNDDLTRAHEELKEIVSAQLLKMTGET